MKLKKYPRTHFVVVLAAIMLISFNTFAQNTKGIPQAVLDAFSFKYPKAKVKSWKTEKDVYIVSFAMDDKKYRASYSKYGDWLSTETKISRIADLPAEIRSYFKTGTYASWKVDDIEMVHTPSQDMYQVHVDNHGNTPLRYEDAASAEDRLLSFDESGKLIKMKVL